MGTYQHCGMTHDSVRIIVLMVPKSYDIEQLLDQWTTAATLEPLAPTVALESPEASTVLGVGFVMDTWRQHVTDGTVRHIPVDVQAAGPQDIPPPVRELPGQEALV